MEEKRPDWPFWIVLIVCGTAILACAAYLVYNYLYLPAQIEKQNVRYEVLYESAANETPVPTAMSTGTPMPSPTPPISPAPTEAADARLDVPLGTPNPDTIIYAFPTPPPIQERFAALLALNSETIGFLTIGDMIALPVVQRQNDNEFYLKHDFEENESRAGCLFLDGVNRLELFDKLLIVYGHNMKNGTMFGQLPNLEFKSVLVKNAVISFDTIYENRKYVPFACFALTADQSEPAYVELRKFQLNKAQFGDYVDALRARSLWDIPVDVQYGDDVLLLVTCNYSVDDGRFCVALRRLRDGENEDDMRTLVGEAVKK